MSPFTSVWNARAIIWCHTGDKRKYASKSSNALCIRNFRRESFKDHHSADIVSNKWKKFHAISILLFTLIKAIWVNSEVSDRRDTNCFDLIESNKTLRLSCLFEFTAKMHGKIQKTIGNPYVMKILFTESNGNAYK